MTIYNNSSISSKENKNPKSKPRGTKKKYETNVDRHKDTWKVSAVDGK
jgi:hypothetical protein